MMLMSTRLGEGANDGCAETGIMCIRRCERASERGREVVVAGRRQEWPLNEKRVQGRVGYY